MLVWSRGERGEGRFGCLLFLLLLVGFVYVTTKAVPVYLDKIEFEEGVARIASQAGVGNWPDGRIITRVKMLAAAKNFQVAVDNIQIRRPARFQPAGEIRISVGFAREVEFPGYVHRFRFRSDFSSLVGGL